MLRFSHSYAGVWMVQEARDTGRPSLMDSGRRTKNLKAREKKEDKELTTGYPETSIK